MLHLLGGCRRPEVGEGNRVTGPPKASASDTRAAEPPPLHVLYPCTHGALSTLPVSTESTTTNSIACVKEKRYEESSTALAPPLLAGEHSATLTKSAEVDCKHTRTMSPFPEESKWPKNPLPPAPNSILMCGQTPSSVEAASRKGCCGGKVGSLSLICDGSNPLVPALRLYGTQLPRLDEADMSVPAKPSAHTSNSSSPPQQEQRALKCFPPLSVRSLGSTPCKSDKMAHSGMVGEVTATSVEVPIGMARRTSVRFLPSQGANGAGTGQTGDAVPGCCRTDGGSARPSAGGAEMMSPRCGTPHRLPGDAYSRRGDRTSAVSTQSCSQRPDSPHQHPGMQDTNIRHSGNDLEGICFLPLGFSSSLHSARVQSHNSVSGILPTGTDGASTSAPSLLSPASILHKSSMTTLSRPSYTTSGNASHQLWRSSQFFGARSGAKDSRCEPECLHSSSSPRFVEDDLSQMQLLSRHDSDSSEDARIVEGAKSVIECFRKRNSAPSTSCGL